MSLKPPSSSYQSAPRDFSPSSRKCHCITLGLPFTLAESVHFEAVELPVATEDDLCFLNYLLFDPLPYFIPNYDLYSEGVKCEEPVKYTVHGDALSPIFCSFPQSVATVLGIVRTKPRAL